jgi:energy-coupling factor transport system permease protein
MRLSFTAKLTLLAAFNILAIALDYLPNLIALTVVAVVIWAVARPSGDRLKLTALVVIPSVWSVVILQGLFYTGWPKTVIFTIIPPETPVAGWLTGGVYLTYQGMLYGLRQSLRIISVAFVGLAVVWTSTEREIVAELRRLLKNAALSVGVTISVRFFDIFTQDAKASMVAYRTAGNRRLGVGMFRLIVPLAVQVLRRSYVVTLALITRGFNPRARISAATRLGVLDLVVITASLAVATTIGLLKLLTLLYIIDVLYIPQLRELYWYVVNYV